MSLLIAGLVGLSGVSVACGDNEQDTEQDGGDQDGGGNGEDRDDGGY